MNSVTLPYQPAITFDTGNADTAFNVTLTGNVTTTALLGGNPGTQVVFNIIQDNSGSHTWAWPSNVLNAPAIQSAANSVTTVLLVKRSSAIWDFASDSGAGGGGGGGTPGGANSTIQFNDSGSFNGITRSMVDVDAFSLVDAGGTSMTYGPGGLTGTDVSGNVFTGGFAAIALENINTAEAAVLETATHSAELQLNSGDGATISVTSSTGSILANYSDGTDSFNTNLTGGTVQSQFTDAAGDSFAINLNGGAASATVTDSTAHATVVASTKVTSGGVVLTAAAATAASGQVALGSTHQTTVGAAGGAAAVPATASGYLIINVAGTNFVIPYFAAA